jgi:hypothetical protein
VTRCVYYCIEFSTNSLEQATCRQLSAQKYRMKVGMGHRCATQQTLIPRIVAGPAGLSGPADTHHRSDRTPLARRSQRACGQGTFSGDSAERGEIALEAFAACLKAEAVKWANAARAAGIQPIIFAVPPKGRKSDGTRQPEADTARSHR